MKIRLYCCTLALAAVWTACTPPKPASPPPPKVTVALPHLGTVTNWDEFPGHVEAVSTVEIRSKVPGYIQSIAFTDGADVKAGDLLFVIDPLPFEAALQRAEAERLRAETRTELARNELQRVEGLRDRKAVSEEEYESRTMAVRDTQAALAAARAAEETARLDLGYCRVKAPIDGRIGRRLVTEGNLVQGSGMMPGTLLATVVSLNPVYAYFDVDEAAFSRYRPRLTGRGNGNAGLPCELGLVDDTGFPYAGRVDFFDNQVDAKTGTLRLRATFANPNRALMPGMFARLRVLGAPPQEAWLVPAVAVGSDQGNRFVLLANAEGVVERRPIEVGRQHGAQRVVTQGLKPEDRVIVNGLMMARPGARVEVVEALPAAGPR